ncbi:hypothetical protein NKI51_28900 [Mesorhizobium australicum]|uniref:hypothetical protein n=1 Tax=Mesorhizobium australicum TaxID=536018 RepID=UPI00333681FA
MFARSFPVGHAGALSLLLGSVCLPALTLPALAFTSEGTAAGSQCIAVDVNDSKVVVGDCLDASGKLGAFVASTAGMELPLAPLVSNFNCFIGGLNNDPLSPKGIGSCQDANHAGQAVVWALSTPGALPLQLQPLFLGNHAEAHAINTAGLVAGVSVNSNGDVSPAYWASGATAAKALRSGSGLLSINNCSVSDINNGATPNTTSAVGHCRSSAGLPVAVLWPRLTLYAEPLTYPEYPESGGYFGDNCHVKQINLSGQMLGTCEFGQNEVRTVRWAAGGGSAVVLATVNGAAATHNSGVDMNDAGVVTGVYLSANSDFNQPYSWDPNTGTDAQSIPGPSRSNTGTPVAIGNNNRILLNFELSTGVTQASTYKPGGSLVADPPLDGGLSDVGVALSPNGCQAAGVSEGSNQALTAVVENALSCP